MKKFTSMLMVISLMLSLVACGGTSAVPDVVENTATTSTPAVEESEPESTVETNLADAVTYDVIDGTNICLMTFTNNSDVDVEVEVNYAFENSTGEKQDAAWGHLYCLGSGQSGVISITKPTNEHFPIEGLTTVYTVAVSDSGLFDEDGSYVNEIRYESDESSDGSVTLTVFNDSDKDLDHIVTAIVYYLGDEPVWYADYGWEAASGENYMWTFDRPHHTYADSVEIEYDSYEIIVNEAYKSQY